MFDPASVKLDDALLVGTVVCSIKVIRRISQARLVDQAVNVPYLFSIQFGTWRRKGVNGATRPGGGAESAAGLDDVDRAVAWVATALRGMNAIDQRKIWWWLLWCNMRLRLASGKSNAQ